MMVWVFIYLVIGLFVLAGMLAFGTDVAQEDVGVVIFLWPVILFYLLMLAIAEKRGPNDPRQD